MLAAAIVDGDTKPRGECGLVPQLNVERTREVEDRRGFLTEVYRTLQVCAVLDTTNDNRIVVPSRWKIHSGDEMSIVGLVILADDENPESRYARLEPFSLTLGGRVLRDSGPHEWGGNYASSDDPRFTSVVARYLGEPAERFKVYDGYPVTDTAEPQV
ncbi:hypothetical protein [Nocardia brasiliensis]|uniref:hypothetical protein n=1 Tax=Nocardia brasiliensis TaxID=37326 RepID=UPI003D8CB708